MSQVMTKAEAMRCHELHGRREEILDSQHPVTPQELRELAAIDEELKTFANKTFPMPKRGQPGQWGPPDHLTSSPSTQYMTADGSTIHCLSPHEKFADLPTEGDNRRLSLGKAIRGVCTGRWEGATAERLAMAEGSNVSGGYLVPFAFAAGLIDKARAASVCVAAGAQTLHWGGSDTLSLAAVKTDPVFELKTENAEFTGSDVAFEQYSLTAKTLGTLVKCSRELAEDAANFPLLIEEVLAKSFAVELDRQCLAGSGSQEILGLLYKPNIPASDAAVGEIDWETLHSAATTVRLANFEPNAYVLNPQIGADLDVLLTGDGTDAAKGWLPPPASLATVRRFLTTSCPQSKGVIGDFSNLLIGIRQEAQLEVSTSASTAFAAHQIWIKLVWRGDCIAVRPSSFATLDAITS